MKLTEFDYFLPKEKIAQFPAYPRDAARLLILKKKTGHVEHGHFYDLTKMLTRNDVLVLNDTKVFPARLHSKTSDGGNAELLLLKRISGENWEAIGKPGKALKQGAVLVWGNVRCTINEVLNDGTRIVSFSVTGRDFENFLAAHGETPLPPYISSSISLDDYQTIFATHEGSVAAPTAGLHFTERLLDDLKEKTSVQIEHVTLHIGRGTFIPVKTDLVESHKMHEEWFSLDGDTAKRLNEYKKNGRRIIAVGTTATRVLEHCTSETGIIMPQTGATKLFIYPGYKFRFIDGLITNFHLPKTTLLMLVCAFASTEFILKAYTEAIQKDYRFYSFGDAMLIC